MNPSPSVVREIRRFDASLPINEAYTPPASWYTSDEFLTLEQSSAFRDHWLFVGRVDQLESAGSYFTGNLFGRPFVVVRDDRGEFAAFYNVCSHHGTCVAKGEGVTKELVCPYHGWTYSLSGALKRAPKAGALKHLKERRLDLKPLPIATWGPLIALHFGEPQHSLQAQLAGLTQIFRRNPFDDVQFVRRVNYTIPCNWKVYVDNYLDGGYHVPHMHPELSANLEMDSYQTTISSNWSIQQCGGQDDARVGSHADYAWIYPNFMLDRYGPWLNTITVIPTTVNECITVFDYYLEGTPDNEFIQQSLAASDLVQKQDIEICQMVQTGLRSGVYDRGIYAPKFEGGMYAFHKRLQMDVLRQVT